MAIILAAGEGRRIGGPKALLTIGATTFLGQLQALYRRTAVTQTVVVTGAEASRVEALCGHLGLRNVVRNDLWKRGMLSSVWCGLEAASALGAGAVLLHPVDHPLVEQTSIDAISRALQAGALIAVPELGGRRGHPGGFSQAVFDELMAAPLERGARALLEAHAGRVRAVPGGPGCLQGIDTPEDYRRLLGGEPRFTTLPC